MQGLRSNEGEDFENFFSIVEEEAKKLGGVFFCDTFEGRDLVLNNMKVCDLGGWLVPASEVEDFESIYVAGKDDELWENDKWYDMYIFVNYSLGDNNELTLKFDKKQQNKNIDESVLYGIMIQILNFTTGGRLDLRCQT